MAANFLASNLPGSLGEAVDAVKALAVAVEPRAPRCVAARAKRYNPDLVPSGSAEEDAANLREFVQDASAAEAERSRMPLSVPVCGVAMTADSGVAVADVAQRIIDRTARANLYARPEWDSSWRPETVRQVGDNLEHASGCLSDFAGVAVCGARPFNTKSTGSTGTPIFAACGSRLHDMATSIHPISEPEEKKSVLRRLLEAQAGMTEPIGLIKRFEPGGARLFVTDRERAKSLGWLASCRLLGGRAVRCLRVDAGEQYPAMRALRFEVDDTLSEPILGYFCPAEAGLYDVSLAERRRKEVKGVLDFIHEGVKAGENVIIHCRLGTNRSVMVALAYLMIFHRMRAQDAIDLVQRRGPSRLVVRQPGFTQQLLLLEQELLLRRCHVDVGDWRDMAQQWGNCKFGCSDDDLAGLTDDCVFLRDKLSSQAGIIERVLAAAQDLELFSDSAASGPTALFSPPSTPATRRAQEESSGMWSEGQDAVSCTPNAAVQAGGGEAVRPQLRYGSSAVRGAIHSLHNRCVVGADVGRMGLGSGPQTGMGVGSGPVWGPQEGLECVSAVVEVLQNQIWNSKVLILEWQRHNVYVLALASPDQHFLEGSPLELCLPLLGATVTVDGDHEMTVLTAAQEIRITAENKRERDELAATARSMAARCSEIEPVSGLAGLDGDESTAEEEGNRDSMPPPAALAHRAQIVMDDSDGEGEVWM